MTKENIGKIISGFVGLALIAVSAYLLVEGQEHGETLLAAGLASLGAFGTLALPRLREPKRELPNDGA